MEQYVTLHYDPSACELGRTILCSCWADAVAACKTLAKEQGCIIRGERLKKLELNGDVELANGTFVHIGGLETL